MTKRLSADERERLLASAWDEATGPYPLPGFPEMQVRPFSVNALRRASTMGLCCLSGEIRRICSLLAPSRALRELESLHWLLTAPLDAVRSAMRTQGWEEAMEHHAMPWEAKAPLLDEMERVLALLDAATFDVEAKPEPKGRKTLEEEEPPAHYVRPGMPATLAFALAEKFGRPADEMLEWVPACLVFQMAHCARVGDPRVWTVDPRLRVEVAPEEIAAPEPDPGYGEAIAF